MLGVLIQLQLRMIRMKKIKYFKVGLQWLYFTGKMDLICHIVV